MCPWRGPWAGSGIRYLFLDERMDLSATTAPTAPTIKVPTRRMMVESPRSRTGLPPLLLEVPPDAVQETCCPAFPEIQTVVVAVTV